MDDKIAVEALTVRVQADEKTAVVKGPVTICQPSRPDGSPNAVPLK
ncbi:hypothetical protein [Hymenobacter algoricola]|uniref:Uncharacterized protein n=1 Tax=Hymenobacter algoricola TaxID=486267 RepID=A0ABP7MJH0_9BACT